MGVWRGRDEGTMACVGTEGCGYAMVGQGICLQVRE